MVNSSPDNYSGIIDATDSVMSDEGYTGAKDILVNPPSEAEVEQWTKDLSGFEVNAEISAEENRRLLKLEKLYERSKDDLIDSARNIGVKGLDEFEPESVLFMVCIRDLQQRFASKTNMNSHKFSVLLGGRYSVNTTINSENASSSNSGSIGNETSSTKMLYESVCLLRPGQRCKYGSVSHSFTKTAVTVGEPVEVYQAKTIVPICGPQQTKPGYEFKADHIKQKAFQRHKAGDWNELRRLQIIIE